MSIFRSAGRFVLVRNRKDKRERLLALSVTYNSVHPTYIQTICVHSDVAQIWVVDVHWSDNYAETAIIRVISFGHFILNPGPREDNRLHNMPSPQSTANRRDDCKNRAELMCMMEFYLFFVPFIGCWKLTASNLDFSLSLDRIFKS